MKLKIIFTIMTCWIGSALWAQDNAVENLSEEVINKRIIGLWIFKSYDNNLFVFQKRKSIEKDELSTYYDIKVDGQFESSFSAINILGQQHKRKESANWKYNHATKTLNIIPIYKYTDPNQLLLWELSDTSMILSYTGMLRADKVFDFEDFKKIENFIRYYGIRKSYKNRWKDNPYFPFPFGDVYLLPYGINPRRYDVNLPYEYFGLQAFLNDSSSLQLSYQTKAFVFVDTQNVDTLKSFAKRFLAISEAYPYESFEKKKMMNEGEVEMYDHKLQAIASYKLDLRLQEENHKNAGLIPFTKYVFDKDELSDLNLKVLTEPFPDPKYSTLYAYYFINRIKQVVMHSKLKDPQSGKTYENKSYNYEIAISDKNQKTYTANISFFNGKGKIVEVYENSVLKVSVDWGPGMEMLPSLYTYVIKMK